MQPDLCSEDGAGKWRAQFVGSLAREPALLDKCLRNLLITRRNAAGLRVKGRGKQAGFVSTVASVVVGLSRTFKPALAFTWPRQRRSLRSSRSRLVVIKLRSPASSAGNSAKGRPA